MSSFYDWLLAASEFGCFYCGSTVSQAVHLANTAYCCRSCFAKYNPTPMPELPLPDIGPQAETIPSALLADLKKEADEVGVNLQSYIITLLERRGK
jgi:hypothetical protein